MHSKHISSGEWKQLKRQLMEMVDIAMNSTPYTREIDSFQDGYQLAWEKHGLRMLVKKSSTSAFHEFLALRHSSMSLDDYIELNYCDTTESFRQQQALLYQDNLINANVITSHTTNSEDDSFRYFGLKYKRLKFAISGGVCEPRDSTFAEISGQLINKRGQRVLFIARESLDLEDYPPLEHIIRFHFKTMVLQTQCDDYVEEAVYLCANPLGSIPAFVFNRVTQASLTISEDFPQALQKKRTLATLEQRPTPAKQSELMKQKDCCACQSKFHSFRARHDCVGCGYAMCSKCFVNLPRVVPGPLNTMSVVRDEVCKLCFVYVRQEHYKAGRSGHSSQCSFESNEDPRDSVGYRSTVSIGNDLDLQDDKDLDLFIDHESTKLDIVQLNIDQQMQLVHQMKQQLQLQTP